MFKISNSPPCRLLSCLFASQIKIETIYANWDMLIGIDEQGDPQYLQHIAGDTKTENRAVFHNIYGCKDSNIKGHKQKGFVRRRRLSHVN